MALTGTAPAPDPLAFLRGGNDWSNALQYNSQEQPSIGNLGNLMNGQWQMNAPGLTTPGVTPGLAGGAAPTSFWNKMTSSIFDKADASGNVTQGWGGLALGAATGIGNLWMGSKQLGMAQDALKESKRQFNLNYDNQVKTTNTQMEDRQRARVATGNSGYESVSSYMDKNAIKVRG